MNGCPNCARIESAYRETLRQEVERVRRWRDSGLSTVEIRDLVTSYEQEEIPLSTLVDSLRGMAEAAVARRLERAMEETR